MRGCRSTTAESRCHAPAEREQPLTDIIRGRLVMARTWRELTAPETVLVSEIATIERIINFVAARRRLRASDADEFASNVKLKLVENDYAILRKFQGRSSLRTYLTIVIQRLFL